jgi:hypothetical protein
MQMTITSITCKSTCSIPPKKDNVFLLIQADAGPPIRYPAIGVVDMGSDDAFTLPAGGYTVEFDYGVVITAWDQDSVVITDLNSPDFLFNIPVSNHTGNGTTTTYNENSASYTYSIEISQ